ncbi:ankyrin repeat domain-containing protein 26 isoform X6 [Canis lupus familiaris]|uniref:ankyrin repeat domain-containing protein 26 isoform X6 n=1 Tax=Canis lupus familiaris TaxID=9615 RepID=UPI0018F7D3B9|nr:ankyrin repeat domain-containing protein 26 isoform X6 [Canis lupus familiaris]
MKKRSAAQDGWGLQRFGSNLRPLSDRSPPMIVSSFHSPGPGYHIKYQDLREIHRAVVADDPKKLQDVEELLHFALCDIKERDRKNRTALHLACAIGRVDVVKYLLAWKCDVNLRDGENRTALVKAVQCQEEACVDILLKKGADPNAKDFKGNTALHYAAFEGNILIAQKLLFNKGEIEAKNKDGLTPVLVALNENKEQMVKFLVGKGARLLSGDTVKSDQLISEHEEEMKPENSSQNHDLVAKKSEEVSLSSRTRKADTDDSRPSKHEDLTSGTKEGATKPAIGKKDNGIDIIESPPQEQAVNDNLTSADRAHKNHMSDRISALGRGEDSSPWDSESISASLPKKSVDCLPGGADQQGQSILNEQVEESPGKDLHWKSTTEVKDSVTNEAVAGKDQQMSRSDFSDWDSSLSLGNETCQRTGDLKVDDKCPFVSQPMTKIESASGEFGQTTLMDKENINIGAVFLLENSTLHDLCESELPENRESKKDLSAELDLEVASEEEQERPDESENNHPQIEKKRKKQKSSKMEGAENIYAAAAAGLIQQRKNGKTDNHLFPTMKNEDSDAPAKKMSKEKNKVKKQMNSVEHLDDLTQSSEAPSEDCKLHYSDFKSSLLLIEQLGMDCTDSVSLLKIQDAILSYERLIELKKNDCEQLIRRIKKMGCKINGLQKELSETKEMKSQLEHQKVEWEQELCSLRFTLKQEKEKRKSADMLYEKIREQLRNKEEQYSKEVEMKQQLELNLRTLDLELKSVKNNLNQVIEERNDIQRQLSQEQNARILQDGILNNHLCKRKEIEISHTKMNSEASPTHEKAKDLLHKNRMLQDEIAMLRLEIDTIRNQNQEKEKKYCEDIEIEKEKNDSLQKTIKLNEVTLTNTVFQYTGQLNVLTTENTMLHSQLDNEKQNKERLEAKIQSYRARLATAIQDHDQSQASKRDLELAFQRAKDEWFRLQDKMNFDVSNLKDNNEVLSQQLSKAESKFNTLEIELHHTRDALREKTLALEHVQRNLKQTQCQKKEIEQKYQNEQSKVNKYFGKQGSLEERLSQLQSENMLLRQQIDDAYSKVDCKEKTVIDIQDQFQVIVRNLQAESEKQSVILQERNKELITECNHLKERIYKYEKEKEEREVVMRQFQQELADALKKQSMSEASLEVTSHYRINLEDEVQDLKKKLDQIKSQLREAQDRYTEAVGCIEKSQDHIQKLEVENAKLKVTIKKQAGQIEQLQEDLLSPSSPSDEKESLKKCMELKQSLEFSLDQEVKKNYELEKENTGFKNLLNMTRRMLSKYENGELPFYGDLKTSQTEMDIQINMLKHKIDDLTAKLETESSRCLHLDAKNQVLQQELLSMKATERKCEKLEKNKKKLEQKVVNLRSHLEVNVVERSQVEKYKREIEERARLVIVEKLKEVNLFLQTQAASQENLEQLRESNNASIRGQLELRIKELESEISKIKNSQEDKAELEKYRQLYLEESKIRMSLTNKLSKTSERLADITTKYLVEKQQNRPFHSTLTMRPVLELPYVGNLTSSLLLDRNVTPRENVVIPTSSSRPSNNSIDTYLTKMQQMLEENITRELKEAAGELESGSCRSFSLGSTDESNLNQHLVLQASQEYVEILKKNYMI